MYLPEIVYTETESVKKNIIYMVIRTGLSHGERIRRYLETVLIDTQQWNLNEAEQRLLSRKKRLRTGHRATATHLITQATTALAAEEVDSDQLCLTKQLLLEKLQTLKAIDAEIMDLVPEEDLEGEIVQADEQVERVYAILAKIEKKLGAASAGLTHQ